MDVQQWEGCTTTEEVLQRLKSVGINMISVTSALANSVLMRDLLATCDGVGRVHLLVWFRALSYTPTLPWIGDLATHCCSSRGRIDITGSGTSLQEVCWTPGQSSSYH